MSVATSNPNFSFLDKFSIAHAAAGTLLAFTSLPWWSILGLTVGFELLEPFVQETFPAHRLTDTQETRWNSIGDVVVAMVAWWLTKQI